MGRMTFPIGVLLAFIAFRLGMDRVTLHFLIIIAITVWSWSSTTPEEAEETNVPFIFMMAIGFFCYEWLLCGPDFFRQGCYGSTLGASFFAYIVIVIIKRNQIAR